EANTLEESLSVANFFEAPGSAARFVKRLAERISAMHQAGLAHGDLKPSNILVDGDADHAPALVDLLDLMAAADGEVVSTAYAPPAGGDRFSRDRFAVTKIAEEVLAAGRVTGPTAV